jgi:hypothetical protein
LQPHRSSARGNGFPPGRAGSVSSPVVATCHGFSGSVGVREEGKGGRTALALTATRRRVTSTIVRRWITTLVFIPPPSPTSSARLICAHSMIALSMPVSGVGFRDGVWRKSISCCAQRGAAREKRSRTRRWMGGGGTVFPAPRRTIVYGTAGSYCGSGFGFGLRFWFSDTMFRALLFLMSFSTYGFIPPSESTHTPHTHVPTYLVIQSSALCSACASYSSLPPPPFLSPSLRRCPRRHSKRRRLSSRLSATPILG